MSEVLGNIDGASVRVRTPEHDRLVGVLLPHASVQTTGPEELEVRGLSAAAIGEAARQHRIAIHHLAEIEQTLEQAYLALTGESVEFRGNTEQNGVTQ